MNKIYIQNLIQPCKNRGVKFENNGDGTVNLDGKRFDSIWDCDAYLKTKTRQDIPGMIETAPPFTAPKGGFQYELISLINKHSLEGGSNTPDYILAEYLRCCLDTFDMVTRHRDNWSHK